MVDGHSSTIDDTLITLNLDLEWREVILLDRFLYESLGSIPSYKLTKDEQAVLRRTLEKFQLKLRMAG